MFDREEFPFIENLSKIHDIRQFFMLQQETFFLYSSRVLVFMKRDNIYDLAPVSLVESVERNS
jgi:hypothetical protein